MEVGGTVRREKRREKGKMNKLVRCALMAKKVAAWDAAAVLRIRQKT
jgi:hypothetical protein